MANPLGSPQNLKRGNKRGPSKVGATLKEAILLAAHQVGEDGQGRDGLTGYLRRVAAKDAKAFSALLGRVLPLQVAGDPENPLTASVTLNIVRPPSP